MCIKDTYVVSNMAGNAHITTGQLGERIAERYLKGKGYSIIKRNYRAKCGELDLIAQKDGILHFIEVKSAACESFPAIEGRDAYRPEQHMDVHKCKRMARTISLYVEQYALRDDVTWVIDLVVVYIRSGTKQARVHVLSDIILG